MEKIQKKEYNEHLNQIKETKIKNSGNNLLIINEYKGIQKTYDINSLNKLSITQQEKKSIQNELKSIIEKLLILNKELNLFDNDNPEYKKIILKKEKTLNSLNDFLSKYKIPLTKYEFIKEQFAVDTSILIKTEEGIKIPLIERKFSPIGVAFPGGFIDEGETIEQAASREVYEEINLKLENNSLKHIKTIKGLDKENIFRPYKQRDPRGIINTELFIAELNQNESNEALKYLQAGDDAASVKLYSFNEIIELMENDKFAQGHKELMFNILMNVSEYTKKIMIMIIMGNKNQLIKDISQYLKNDENLLKKDLENYIDMN